MTLWCMRQNLVSISCPLYTTICIPVICAFSAIYIYLLRPSPLYSISIFFCTSSLYTLVRLVMNIFLDAGFHDCRIWILSTPFSTRHKYRSIFLVPYLVRFVFFSFLFCRAFILFFRYFSAVSFFFSAVIGFSDFYTFILDTGLLHHRLHDARFDCSYKIIKFQLISFIIVFFCTSWPDFRCIIVDFLSIVLHHFTFLAWMDTVYLHAQAHFVSIP